jgi:hypothetical protein
MTYRVSPVVIDRGFASYRDRQMYNEKSTQNGSIFRCVVPKILVIMNSIIVTRRERRQSVCFIEPAIQMFVVSLLSGVFVQRLIMGVEWD